MTIVVMAVTGHTAVANVNPQDTSAASDERATLITKTPGIYPLRQTRAAAERCRQKVKTSFDGIRLACFTCYVGSL